MMASEQVEIKADAQVNEGDIEAPAVVQAPATEEVEKEYLGRTSSEWGALMPSLCSITMFIFGCMNFSDCSGIPSLPAYAIVFGALNVLNGVIAIVFRTEKTKAAGGDGGVAGKAAMLIGLAILGCAVWGAVITWGETSRFSESPDCANQLYVASFISSVIPWIVIACMLVGCVAIAWRNKVSETPSSPIAKPAQLEQEGKETSHA
jgi:hypothetical protein